MNLGDQQIVLLGDHGDKIQAQGLGRGLNAQAGIGGAAGHSGSYCHVGELFVAVTGDALRREAQLLEPVVEQNARARAALAVDHDHIVPHQVFDPVNALGIAGRHDQALVAHHQMHQAHRQIRHQVANVGDIVGTGGLVQQMGAGQMAHPTLDGHQAAHAAHMARRKRQVRGLGPQLVGQQIQGIVVAADHNQRALDGGQRPQQLRRHRLTFGQPFHMGRNADDAVGLGDAGDLSGPAGQGRGHQPLAHLPDLDAHELFGPQLGGDFAGGQHIGHGSLGRRLAQHARQQRLNQLLEGHDGRYGIPRHAEDRLVRHAADDRGLARHHGDAVHQDLAHLFHGAAGEIFGAGR